MFEACLADDLASLWVMSSLRANNFGGWEGAWTKWPWPSGPFVLTWNVFLLWLSVSRTLQLKAMAICARVSQVFLWGIQLGQHVPQSISLSILHFPGCVLAHCFIPVLQVSQHDCCCFRTPETCSDQGVTCCRIVGAVFLQPMQKRPAFSYRARVVHDTFGNIASQSYLYL